jgi:hypothetical protein
MQARLRISLFLLLVSCLSAGLGTDVRAADESKVVELQSAARQQKLWIHAEWLKLLHYRREGLRWVSQVDDDRFFNAPDGKTNPESELNATIAAFYRDGADDDEHPLCRFPARLQWLQRKLDNGLSGLPSRRCELYKEWRPSIPDQRMTLVFPAYHLNSPSSMFGHTLLRLDPADVDSQSDWLSIAVNFGADVRSGENSILYAFKGLSGGYPGFFIVSPYFKKIREYNQDENRDIWEYRLNLRPEEIRVMATHLWELKETRFDYYFFDENCSYRLLELIEVARPGIDLTSPFGRTVIPVDTVRVIEQAGLIESAAYRPSQVTVLEHLLAKIPSEHHPLVEQIAADPERAGLTDFKSLDGATQRQVVDAAYRYLRYEKGLGPRETIVAKNSYRLLEQLNAYPTGERVAIQNFNRPEAGHGSRRLSIAAGSRDGAGFVDLGYRMSFHNLEDREAGFLQGAQINLGNFELRAQESESLRLQRLDVVDIFSLTPRSSLFTPVSWRVYAGLERQPTNERDVLTGHVTGGAGVAYSWIQNSQTYLMASLRLENNGEFERAIEPAAGLLAGHVHHFGSSTAHLQLATERFSNDRTRRRASYTHNFVLEANHAIRANLLRQDHDGSYVSEAGLAYQYYFW